MKIAHETKPVGRGARRGQVQRKAVPGRPPGHVRAPANPSLERQAEEAADMAVRQQWNVSRILTAAPVADYDRATTPGRPLPTRVRAPMEERFSAVLDEVRVHDDVEAHSAAREEQARAFTAGRDIYFGQGQFAPDSADGARLLAHEIAHVLQQTGRRVSVDLVHATAREGKGPIQPFVAEPRRRRRE